MAESEARPRAVFFTGPIRSGKSTLLGELVRRLLAQGYRLAGILAPSVWKSDRRVGFDLVDLSRMRREVLARWDPEAAAMGGVPFRFSPQGMAAGRRALSPETAAGADLVVVDEVGNLEMRDGGWAPELPPLLALPRPVHLWVVRLSLLEAAAEKFGLAPLVVDATADRPLSRLEDMLVELMGPPRPVEEGGRKSLQ